MRRCTAILAAPLLLAACLKQQLQHPAEDHYVQAETIATACAADVACEDYAEDMAAMAKQACLIDAILKGEDGTACAVTKADHG